MKKSAITLSVFGLLAGSAAAQSSVSLFGIMDVAVRNVKNGSVGSTTSMVSGGNATSRWGIRGSEDLGSGLRAGFWIEGDIGVDTGTANATFWNRRSTVSLSSSSLGELRLGRDMIPTHVASCSFDPFSCVGMAGAIAFRSTQAAAFSGMGGVQVAFRANNAVSYFTPDNLGGFSAQVMVSAGEGGVSAGTEQAESQGLRVAYRNGPVNVQAATRLVKNATATVRDFKDNVLGASYDFGVVKVALQRRDFKFNTAKLEQTMLHLSAPLGNGTVKFTYVKADQISPNATVNANDSSLMGLGYQYNLSKRTSLYTTVAKISNKNRATFTVAGGAAVTAANFGGQSSRGYEVGIQHNF